MANEKTRVTGRYKSKEGARRAGYKKVLGGGGRAKVTQDMPRSQKKGYRVLANTLGKGKAIARHMAAKKLGKGKSFYSKAGQRAAGGRSG